MKEEIDTCTKCGKPLFLAQRSPDPNLCINCYLKRKKGKELTSDYSARVSTKSKTPKEEMGSWECPETELNNEKKGDKKI